MVGIATLRRVVRLLSNPRGRQNAAAQQGGLRTAQSGQGRISWGQAEVETTRGKPTEESDGTC